jgi:hypothetical protein
MPPQIIRLVLLTIAIVGAYFTARYFLVPPSFGQYGHYCGAALEEIRTNEPFWAGRGACDVCHSEIAQKLAKAEHQGNSCEACHGPAEKHAEDPDGVKLPKMSPDKCLRCHEASPSRPKWLHQITLKDHYDGGVCTDCHDPHNPKP